MSKLNPKMIREICEHIEQGNTIKTAVACCGVSTAIFHRWVEEGKKPNAKRKYVDFLDALEKAKAQAERRNVAVIQSAAIETWQAAAWWLERRNPNDFARTDKVIHGGGLTVSPKEAEIDSELEGIERRLSELEGIGSTKIAKT